MKKYKVKVAKKKYESYIVEAKSHNHAANIYDRGYLSDVSNDFESVESVLELDDVEITPLDLIVIKSALKKLLSEEDVKKDTVMDYYNELELKDRSKEILGKLDIVPSELNSNLEWYKNIQLSDE